jgi:DNA-binding MarR family transcriptional regulator
VDLSGIIFVVLAIAWAVYLVPKALKHHDEVVRNRSVDRFSSAMRVLARREPVDRRSARLVVTPAGQAERPSAEPRPKPSVAARRAAARAAARRRRRVLGVLLGLDLVTVLLAVFAVVAWWGAAIPVALTVTFLVLARAQVRRENDALWTPAAVADRVEGEDPPRPASPSPDTVAPRRAIRVDAPYGTVQASRLAAEGEEGFSADEDTVQLAMSELQTVAVSVETDDGGSLWDPLPVTLPTYVNKARAARSVRTIDLGAPDAWTSGRDEADTALVERAAAAETAQAEGGQEEQPKAVGS